METNWLGWYFTLAGGANRPKLPNSALQTEIIHQMRLNASEVNNIEGPVQAWPHRKGHFPFEPCYFCVFLVPFLPHSHVRDCSFSDLYSALTGKYCQPDWRLGFNLVPEENVAILESCIHQQRWV